MTRPAGCKICGISRSAGEFSQTKAGYFHSYCKTCDNARSKHERTVLKPEASILTRLKSRCKQRNLEFSLEVSDITIPTHCPVLGIPLKFNSHLQDDSISVDRIDPKKGYVKGNIDVMSMRANRIKTDATIEELERVLEYMKRGVQN